MGPKSPIDYCNEFSKVQTYNYLWVSYGTGSKYCRFERWPLGRLSLLPGPARQKLVEGKLEIATEYCYYIC